MTSTRRRLSDIAIEPTHVLIVLGLLAALTLSAGPITDIDSFWHVVVGREILERRTVHDLGANWSLYSPAQPWMTTQWLSEVVMAKAQSWFGWSGLVWLRLLLTLGFLASAAHLVLSRTTARIGAVVLTALIVPLAMSIQERPALASLLFTVWLAGVAANLLHRVGSPRWWVVGLVVMVWANVHGLWVLAPATFMLIAVGRVVDARSWRGGGTRQPLLLFAVSIVAGSLTPLGPAGLLAPLRFRAATSVIAEWQPTEPSSTYVWGLLVMVGLCVVAWIYGARRPQPSRLIYLAAWTFFAFMAFRNVAPAAVMVAPITAVAMTEGFGRSRAKTAPRERLVLLGLVAAIIVAGIGYTVVDYARTDALKDTTPLTLARALAKEPGEKRVLNAYNASGVLVAFGGPDVKLAIDGRADRYGSTYINDYLDILQTRGPWEQFIRDVDPNYAVIRVDGPLQRELRRQGWTEVATDPEYVLLKRPSA